MQQEFVALSAQRTGQARRAADAAAARVTLTTQRGVWALEKTISVPADSVIIEMQVTFRNTSDKPLQTMGPEPGFTYVQGQTYFTQFMSVSPDRQKNPTAPAYLEVKGVIGGTIHFELLLPDVQWRYLHV